MPAHSYEIVKSIINRRDWSALLDWQRQNRSATRILQSFLLSEDSLTRYRAAEGLGKLSAAIYRDAPHRVEELLRRLLWGMNDESGNLIWGAPEAIAEILYQIPELIPKFARLLASYIDVDPFPRGVHWAIARISELNAAVFSDLENVLKESLASPDPLIRACAGIALLRISKTNDNSMLKELLKDEGQFEVYNFQLGEMTLVTVRGYFEVASGLVA